VAWDVFHDDGYSIQEEMNDPIAFHPHAFAASSNPHTKQQRVTDL